MSSTCRVSPFGNLRISSYLPIPEAYRSLSRPSSPPRAKASPVYSLLLSSTHAPFAPHGMLFLLLSWCLILDFWLLFLQVSTNTTVAYCCLLFFFNFFQYVKELFFQVMGYKLWLQVYTFNFWLSPFNLRWWRITESNRWPPACKAGALASWANPPKKLIRSPVQIWTGDPYIISVVL